MKTTPKRVFFSCSMRGGFSKLAQAELQKIPDLLEALGLELLSRHQTRADFMASESRLSEQQIHDRDYQWLRKAELVVAEITNPSLGVGAEIADAVRLGIPVLAVYRREYEQEISAYIRGKAGVLCRPYSDMTDLQEIIRAFIATGGMVRTG